MIVNRFKDAWVPFAHGNRRKVFRTILYELNSAFGVVWRWGTESFGEKSLQTLQEGSTTSGALCPGLSCVAGQGTAWPLVRGMSVMQGSRFCSFRKEVSAKELI